MIKDRPQKQLALRFCAAQQIVPFTEVVVRSETGLEETDVNITDLDVLGLELGRHGAATRIIFDCKSGFKLSAVNRALWAAGLRQLVGADGCFIIQQRDAPHSHKLAANSLGVRIHSEDSFRRYAVSLSPAFLRVITYLDDLDEWDRLLALATDQPAVAEAVWCATTFAALERSGPKGIRSTLGTIIGAAPELDPKKPLHRLLFGCLLSGFLIFLNVSIARLKDIISLVMSKDEFERTLRYFVWEGRENYINKGVLMEKIDKLRGDRDASQYDLPGWDRFVRLLRSFLDAPEELKNLPFLVKELAFRSCAPNLREDADEALRRAFNASNRTRQFIFWTAAFLTEAARLPRDFATLLERDVNDLLAVPAVAPTIPAEARSPEKLD